MPKLPPHFLLQKRLKSSFATRSIYLGTEYFRDRAIHNFEFSETAACATVDGTEPYQVSLNWANAARTNSLEAHCSCPHFASENFCKHIWALILHLDKEGVPQIAVASKIWKIEFGDPQTQFDTVSEGKTQSEAKPDQPLKSADWRRVLKIERKGPPTEDLSRQEKKVIVTIGADEKSSGSVKLRFLKVQVDSTSRALSTRPAHLRGESDIRHLDKKSQKALKAVLQLSEIDSGQRQYHGYYQDRSERSLKVSSLDYLLPLLVDAGVLYLSEDHFLDCHKQNLAQGLKLARFANFGLKLVETENEYLISAEIEISTPDESAPRRLAGSQVNLIAEPNLCQFENSIGWLELSDIEEPWWKELSKHDLTVPRDDSDAFLEAVLGQGLRIELPASLTWQQKSVAPQARVDLVQDKSGFQKRFFVDLKFAYGPRWVSARSSQQAMASGEDRTVYVRNPEAEMAIETLLPEVISVKTSERPTVAAADVPELIKTIMQLGLSVQVESQPVRTASDFSVSVSSGLDWFDVDGRVQFSDRWVKLPQILQSMIRGEIFVPLGDGTMALIDDALKRRLEKLSAFSQGTGGRLRFAQSQGLILTTLLADENVVDMDQKFSDLKKRVQSFSGVLPSAPESTFQGTLRPYQKEGLGWLKFLDQFGLGGILADDMGLGKTIQCLAFLDSKRKVWDRPSFLVAPKSVIDNWQTEAEKFTPKLRTLVHSGITRQKSAQVFQKYDLVITTYQTMLRDIDIFAKIEWSSIIADEAQMIKNRNAQISRAIKLLPAQMKLAMTGTPIENSIDDLYSISDFVNPGFLSGRASSASQKFGDDARAVIARAFKPIILRRTKDQVLKELPAKTEQMISVELEPKQMKIYNDLKKHYQRQLLSDVEEQGLESSKIQILAALTRLRQVALHPALVNADYAEQKSSKFEVLLEMLEEIIAEGHRVLIFSQFTELLKLLKPELEAKGIQFSYLDGKTTKRKAAIDDFKNSQTPVFLISLKAGGVGLNLVEADYVFLLDPWWNPAVENQAIDRAHRIGQTRPVMAYRLIAKNTVEEKILELQKSKRSLFSEIIDQNSTIMKKLTVADLENLFS